MTKSFDEIDEEDKDDILDMPSIARIIVRNRRITRLLELGAPDIIVKNERWLLWEEEVAAGRRVVC